MGLKAPAVFVSHGSPMVALENDAFTRALEYWGKKIEKPHAIVALSAHWESDAGIRITTSERPETIHDFTGFPDALSQMTYPCAGDPMLARAVISMLALDGIDVKEDLKRGYDHGVWIPLKRLFPNADVPVVEISLGGQRRPQEIFKIGQALAAMRDRGVMMFGTGGVVHNLRLVNFANKNAPVDPWARAFDFWVKDRLERNEIKELMNYRETAPNAAMAVPTSEHFDPIFFTCGAAEGEKLIPIFEGFHHGNLSMRSFATA